MLFRSEVNIFFIIGGKRSIFTISLLGRIPDISTRFCLDAGLIGFRFRGSDPRETVYALCLARYPSPKSPGELARVWGTETSIMPSFPCIFLGCDRVNLSYIIVKMLLFPPIIKKIFTMICWNAFLNNFLYIRFISGTREMH